MKKTIFDDKNKMFELEKLFTRLDVQENSLENFLRNKYDFKRNIITGRNEIKTKEEDRFFELDEVRFNSMIMDCRRNGIDAKPSDYKILINSDFIEEYDPFIDYARSLPNWIEGDEDYIQRLAETVTVDENDREFWNLCLKKWCVAALGCAIIPEIINQTVLLLTGPQGVGKTTWLTRLLPPELKSYYYSGSINPTNKDSIINCAECFIVNMDELGGFVQKKDDDFKELITKNHIRVRRPYSSKFETIPRRCSFVGSTNKFQFLNDGSGSRRILSFEALAIVIPDFDIQLVWSQALSLYNSGFQHWFSREEEEQLNNHNYKHQIITFEEELILSHFEPAEDDQKVSLTATQILQLLVHKDPNARKSNLKQIGQALQKNNFRPRKSSGAQFYDVKIKEIEK